MNDYKMVIYSTCIGTKSSFFSPKTKLKMARIKKKKLDKGYYILKVFLPFAHNNMFYYTNLIQLHKLDAKKKKN